MELLQQRCKQQRPLRSHSSTVQLHAMSDDMNHDVLHGDVAWPAPTVVPLRGRLKVLFSNAFELEVEQGTVGMLGPSPTRSMRRRRRARTPVPLFWYALIARRVVVQLCICALTLSHTI